MAAVSDASPHNFPFKAVLWDVDGTLADSEPTHFQSFLDASADLGIDLPHDFHARFLGQSDEAIHRWLVEHRGLTLSLDVWLHRRFSAYIEGSGTVGFHPLAREIWQRLDTAGVRQAVVSNADRMVLMTNLKRLDLIRPGFVSVALNDVRHGKPEPEPYLRAAHLLGLPPNAIAVVEDSGTGLRAGVAAGMTVFMMPWFDGKTDCPWKAADDLLALLDFETS